MSGITEILRGINGSLELNRVVGAFGGLIYVIAVQVFVAYEVIWLGRSFDITAYCLAFAGGLATITTGTAVAVAVKDRNVASSKVIEATGSKPATPPNPAPEAKPEIAAATNGEAEVLPDYAA